MKRDPSLHITKSNLERILNRIEYNVRTSGKSLADAIFDEAIPYQLRDRYKQVLEQKTTVRARIVKSEDADSIVSDSDVKKMNQILHSVRMAKNPNIIVKPILRDSKDYLMLKEITVLAVRFCETFEIENRTDGFREYINVGLGMMRKYALNRFKYYDSKIHENLQNRIILTSDENLEGTVEFRSMLEQAMTFYTGMDFTIHEDDLDANLNVYYARQQADEVKADYEDWIIGQFEGLAFLNVVPELNQFYGDNAHSRYKKYLVAKAHEDNIKNEESLTNQYKDYEGE